MTPAGADKATERPPLTFAGKMILAPMVKIGTTPLRLLALSYGADIVYTEEIVDHRLLRSDRIENAALNCVDFVDRADGTLVLRVSPRERGHLVLQIGTCDAGRAAQVAKLVEKDVDGIDLNCGCPKSFSLKGGMGAALLKKPDKIKQILTSLVQAVTIPITCKIRILPDLEDTLSLVKVIESTGIAALAVHGRTKDERPNHANHLDVIQEIVKHCAVPVIANGVSSNNRNSSTNSYSGIRSAWKESGASSVMIARAAEWNPSVFKTEGKESTKEVVEKYLDLAIEYDYSFIISKYTVQQFLGAEQRETDFLTTGTMRELCAIFGKEEVYVKRQEFLRSLPSSDYIVLNRKRKHTECEDVPLPADTKTLHAPFVRNHFIKNPHLAPKNQLHIWARVNGHDLPVYSTTPLQDSSFRAVVTVVGKNFSSLSREKNKRYAENAAARVALHYLGVQLVEDQVTLEAVAIS